MSTLAALRPDAADTLPPDRRRRIALVVAGVVVLAVFGTWLVAFSSVFGVGGVTVRGTNALTTAEVRRAADIAQGTPLVRLDTAAVTRRVERLPEVASAQVSTSFPSTVDITVVERRPVAYVRQNGQDVLVDRTGLRYRTVHSVPTGLPVIDSSGGSGSDAVRAALARVGASLPAALRSRVRSLQALGPQSITLVLQHGRIVQWGSAARSADKARVLAFLIDRGARQINLTDPDQPFTR